MKILKVKCLAPTRLDNYLMQQFPALNPGRLNKALRENKIKLNGKKQPLSTRVMAGDEIKLFILDEVLDADKRVEGPAWKNARGPAQVIYDCPQILVVNKPAGLAVDGPEDDTLLNRALLYLNQQGEYKENDLYTPALCHRLDTGTSGLVLIAKTPEAEQLFLEVIKNREVKKTYLCVTFGRPTPPDGTLGGYLLKDADRGIVKIVPDKQPGAKDVETSMRPLPSPAVWPCSRSGSSPAAPTRSVPTWQASAAPSLATASTATTPPTGSSSSSIRPSAPGSWFSPASPPPTSLTFPARPSAHQSPGITSRCWMER